MPAGVFVEMFYTASNRDNARATIPLVAAAQVERRSSPARRV
nr:MAG TPA: hypothetical protein [Caudoviricetes sp.]